jgi:diguanylate cyclase (GGDEF)-like protein
MRTDRRAGERGGDARTAASAFEEMFRHQQKAASVTPPRAVVFSFACLGVAILASLSDAEIVAQYASFVWILALLPVFLLSYYRGWRGATVAASFGMIALIVVQLMMTRMHGGTIDWWLVGTATALLVPITIGAGLLSELLRRQRSLALEMAYGDPMTHVANRRWLREAVAAAIADAAETRTGVGLVFLDLVDFKSINDNHGHAVGDEVLRQLANRLVAGCRGGDSVARVGGDEFVICCLRITSLDTAVSIARRTLGGLERPLLVGEREFYVRARVGIAWYPDHADTFDELLSNADPVRVGEGKPSGGEIIVFNPTTDTSVEERQMIEQDLRKAIDEKRLFLACQPIVGVEDGRLVGAEALARLDHPRLGVVQAHAFVATAQTAGLMYELDMRVLELAVEATLESVREAGIGLSLDNMGPGSFSLAYLEDVPADCMKLDRAVVDGLGASDEKERLARALLGMAGALDMKTVAVGIETREQLAWLSAHGCELAQGYLTGKPMAPENWYRYRMGGIEAARRQTRGVA